MSNLLRKDFFFLENSKFFKYKKVNSKGVVRDAFMSEGGGGRAWRKHHC